MSDEEDFMMSDNESFDFEFEDDDEEMLDNEDVSSNGSQDNGEEDDSSEGLYYQAKHLKQDSFSNALPIFKKIVEKEDLNETELIQYKFKALKQMLKCYYNLGEINEFLDTFNFIFTISLHKLSKHYVDDSLGRILDRYIGLDASSELQFLDTFINKSQSSNRSKLKSQLKRCQILLDLKQFDRVASDLDTLYQKLEAMPEVAKNTYLLELCSIEIQVYSETSNTLKLKELYNKTLSIQSTIPHPKINAIIKECGGKMYLRAENYDLASNEFYESFKNYDEIGNQDKRINILKYLIASSILSDGEINKFESQETKYFLKDKQVLKFVKLIQAFESLKNVEFDAILRYLLDSEKDDDVLVELLYKIQGVFKLRFLVHFIKPFKRLEMSKLCAKLQLSANELEDIFLNLKNNGKLPSIKLDLIDGVIHND